MGSRPKRVLALLAIVWLAGALSACASGEHAPVLEPEGVQEPPRGGYDGPVPEFSGPWADEFVQAYRNSASDFERAVLEDGVISEAEYVETQERFRACLAEGGIELTESDPDGSFEYRILDGATHDQANEIVVGCEVSTGDISIGVLSASVRRNPGNLAEGEIIAACLVEQGAVEKGYTADDYMRGSFPFIDAESGAGMLDYCSADPLGVLGVDPSDFTG